ncbi:MAG: hypothetical protein AAGB04_05960 [Pseudomonadota bacterium]
MNDPRNRMVPKHSKQTFKFSVKLTFLPMAGAPAAKQIANTDQDTVKARIEVTLQPIRPASNWQREYIRLALQEDLPAAWLN